MKKKRILIAEDNRLLREGLAIMIDSEESLEVAGEAENGLEAVKYTLKYKPDLVMIDLSMPKMDGISAIKEIRRQNPETLIFALTLYDSEEFILACFDAGVQGYCLKDASQEDLLKAIQVVLSGKMYIYPGIAGKVMEGYRKAKNVPHEKTPWDTLTWREREVLKAVGEGYSSKQIADFLCISPKTVERHRSNIMNKLNLHNVSNLTAFAIQKGLVVRSANETPRSL